MGGVAPIPTREIIYNNKHDTDLCFLEPEDTREIISPALFN